MANYNIKNNKAQVYFNIPRNMQEQYELYIEEILEDSAFIIEDVEEEYTKESINGVINVEFHENMYNQNTNITFIKDIENNITMLEKCISLYKNVNEV